MRPCPMVRGHHTEDPREALAATEPFLATAPVPHNVLLTLLLQRIERPEPGHYWWVTDEDGMVRTTALLSPVAFRAALAPVQGEVLDALVDVMHETVPALPGVIGEAGAAASFAGRWTERSGSGARPTEGERVYELVPPVVAPGAAAGRARTAVAADVPTLAEWCVGFTVETALPGESDPVAWAHARLDELWVWDQDGPVSMALVTPPAVGVSRIGWVYTPPARRGAGAATALVAHVSQVTLDAGVDHCILYTQLENPTSNGIYRRIGYRAVGEVLHYAFDHHGERC